jgi:3-hydroxybutyryl-CoA dehydratase
MTPDEPLYVEELEVGREWVSAGRVVTAADVSGFADLTGDRNPLHLDPEYARSTPFRRCVAHGLLGLSLAGGLGLSAPPVRVVAVLGIESWEFLAPVYVGDAIRVRQRVLSVEPHGRGRRGVVRWRVEVETVAGRAVQSGVTVLLVEARNRLRAGGAGEEPLAA